MKKLFFLTILGLLVLNVKAQYYGGHRLWIDGVRFTEFREVPKYDDIKSGNPYVVRDWGMGKIVTNGTGEIDGFLLKFDEVGEELLVMGEGDTVKNFAEPILAFTIKDSLKDRVFVSGFKPTKNSNSNTYFEVIADGKIKLLKKNYKRISEYKEYSGTIAKIIKDDIQYFVVGEDNEPKQIKLDQKSILVALSDKASFIDEYIKSNKINFKEEADLVSVFQFYNKG
jgi:hypothetical protein